MQLATEKIPADLGGSGWYEILPPPPAPRILESSIKADWVIIGAGFAGLTAAKRIVDTAPGEKIVVLDAQRIGWGAAGRNSGFMIDLPHHLQTDDYSGVVDSDKKEIRMNRFAIDYTKSMIDEFCLHEFSSPIGRIHGASDPAGMNTLNAYSKHLDALGEPYIRYDRGQLGEVIGSDYYLGGIRTPGCLLIQPAGYIRGVADGLGDNIKVYENSPALKIQTGSNPKVTTPSGEIDTRNIIITTNGHLQSFGLYSRQLMHIFLYASMTQVMSGSQRIALGGEEEWGVTPAKPLGTTVRRTREGRIIIRNHITYNPTLECSARQIEKAAKRHRTSFENRFPMLGNMEMQYRWAGQLCLSRNSVPVFGEVEKGLYVACCQNGLGVSKGTLAGALIVDFAMGADNPLVGEMLEYEAPEKLYPEPFMTLGAKTHLWWGQYRAGRDL
jgi:glycine/D-amino acid oxidase-like deaminating enzyme